MLDHTTAADTTLSHASHSVSPVAPPDVSGARCFVGNTGVATTWNFCLMQDLARMSTARDECVAAYADAVQAADNRLATRLASIDASANALRATENGALGEAFDAAIDAAKAARTQEHDQEVAALLADRDAQIDAILPQAYVRDPVTGERVARRFVKVWAQPQQVSALVDVQINTLIELVDNQEVERPVYVRCTPEHVFITPSGDVQAQHLAGVLIWRMHPNGSVDTYEVPDVQIIELDTPVTVYDAEVEGIASYCVSPSNGPAAVVHNSHYTGDKSLSVERLFSRHVTEYAWRDVVVDFKSGKTLSCRVPVKWSDNAAATLMSKYAVRAGVSDELGGVNGREVDAERIFDRLVAGWRAAAIEHGYWSADAADLAAFCDEIKAMLEQQVAAPNSPQWFNTGAAVQYGITAGSDGHYFATIDVHGEATAHACTDSLARPQISACFIQHVDDKLVGDGGIMSLWEREALLFKYGSGSGSNYSALRGRGEPLSRGGASSGLLSFLRVGDRSAGAIKSGGTTRRSARMVIVDVDHPDIEEFIAWKPTEDAKIRALHAAGIGDPRSFEDAATETVSGQNANNSVAVSDDFMSAVINAEPWDLRARVDGSVTKTVQARDLWYQIVDAAWQCADPGLQFNTTINDWHTCKSDGQIKAANPCCLVQSTLVHTEHGFVTIGDLAAMDDRGQALPRVWAWDSSAPVLRQCLRAWKAGDAHSLVTLTTSTGTTVTSTPEHRFLLTSEAYVQAFDVHLGRFVQGAHGGQRVDARTLHGNSETSVPVFDIEVEGVHNFMVTDHPDHAPLVVHNSEYVFLDDTACNLASINLAKLIEEASDPALRELNYDAFTHAVRLWTIVLDISVSMAGYPTAEIARRSMLYRTLGLGYAALGELLVVLGLGYGTSEGRDYAAQLTSLMTCIAYRTSAELAAHLGAFPRYATNSADMHAVLRKHKAANNGQLAVEWEKTIELARDHGVRNAQVTLLAPCGTIGIVMDCETTGIEPYYSDTIVKQLAGGGYMRFASERFAAALRERGYDPEDHTRRCWTIEHGKVCEYTWIEPPAELSDVLVCASTLAPEQHVDMMAAVQPFLSGAISKTVNLPSMATRDDVAAMYMRAWKSGLKSIAIYRDGCKPAQPLQGRMPAPSVTMYTSRVAAEQALAQIDTFADAVADNAIGEAQRVSMHPTFGVAVLEHGDSVTLTYNGQSITTTGRNAGAIANALGRFGLARGEREMPPDDANARSVRLVIGGHTLYLNMSEYDDGRLAAVFVTSPRTGSAVSGWVNAWAKMFSLALQHGVPLDVLTAAARGEQFEPAGYLNGRPVSSPVDAFARIIDARYLADDIDTAPTLSEATQAKPAKVHATSNDASKPTGHACTTCGSMDLRKSGSCFTCNRCGTTTGCS